jgi:hypothetical protein
LIVAISAFSFRRPTSTEFFAGYAVVTAPLMRTLIASPHTP